MEILHSFLLLLHFIFCSLHYNFQNIFRCLAFIQFSAYRFLILQKGKTKQISPVSIPTIQVFLQLGDTFFTIFFAMPYFKLYDMFLTTISDDQIHTLVISGLGLIIVFSKNASSSCLYSAFMSSWNFCNIRTMFSLPLSINWSRATEVLSSFLCMTLIEAMQRKVTVHTTQRDFESVHNMQYWNNLLPKNCFFQTHRSFIINFEHVTDFDHMLVHMADNQYHAYLTRRKYSAFKEAYLLYLESTR